MVLPLAVGLVGAGAGAGILGSAFGGGTKNVTSQDSYISETSKKTSITDQSQFTFSPQTSKTSSFNPQINLGSGSSLSKKEQTTSKPAQEVTPTASVSTRQRSAQSATPEQSSSQSTGMKKLLLAGLVAGGGYIALKQMNIGDK